MSTTFIKPKSINSPKYPDFLKKNPYIHKYTETNTPKVFPQYGLKNSIKEIEKFSLGKWDYYSDNWKGPVGTHIVFSYNWWDIATMSARGCKSCQSWDSDSVHKYSLIGSMIDPNCGIVYLTDKKQYGQKGFRMLARCVVRFVLNKRTNKPAIFLEEPYFHQSIDERDYSLYKNPISRLFKEFLQSKTNVQVITPWLDGIGGSVNYYIPLTDAVYALDQPYLSYVDSDLIYRTPPKQNPRNLTARGLV